MADDLSSWLWKRNILALSLKLEGLVVSGVTVVRDRLKACELLKEMSHHINIVLTVVELPLMFKYALLTLLVEDNILEVCDFDSTVGSNRCIN